jgi:hypothetical protein
MCHMCTKIGCHVLYVYIDRASYVPYVYIDRVSYVSYVYIDRVSASPMYICVHGLCDSSESASRACVDEILHRYRYTCVHTYIYVCI